MGVRLFAMRNIVDNNSRACHPFQTKMFGPYVVALISGLGITVVSGVIESVLSDTISCIETNYTWTLTGTTDSYHSKNVTGAKYYITDTKSVAKDKT